MNSLNRWCQLAALGLMLVLGIEGFLFGNDVAAQRQALADKGPTLPARHSLLAALEGR